MMNTQQRSSHILDGTEDDDLHRYLRLSGPRMASPRQHRDLLCLPPLTDEDITEYPYEASVLGEHPIWKEKFDAGEVSLFGL
jgi:hypothetical protein